MIFKVLIHGNIQLTIAIIFISSKNTEKELVKDSRSNNIKFNLIMMQLKLSVRTIYQGNLERSMKGSDFIFYSVQLIYCKCHKVNFRRGCLYIASPHWIKKKKSIKKSEK